MKGVILAGGTGSRLMPLTKAVNKHLLSVGGVPMIYRPIKKLVEAGITEILIVTGTEHIGTVVQSLGSGSQFGVNFTYKVQDEAGGIAQALGLANGFIGEHDTMCVILGDNVFENSIISFMPDFEEGFGRAHVVLAEVPDLYRFGVAFVESNGFQTHHNIIQILEKPTTADIKRITQSGDTTVWPYAITGVYFYDNSVFEVIDGLSASARGELEISDVNSYYLSHETLSYSHMHGWWTDAGTHESLITANKLVLRN